MSTEELTVKFADTINQPVIRQRVEDIVEEDLRWRQAFRVWDATGVSTNTLEIPVPNDDMGKASLVEQGSEFPREQETYKKVPLTFDKYGFEVALTHEAIEDSMLNVVNDQVDRQGRQLAETLNDKAFEEITASGNTHADGFASDGAADGIMTYGDVIAGRKQLMKSNYKPDLLIVDLDAGADLLNSNNFLEASEMQGEMRRSGQIGRIAGMDVVEANDGKNLTGTVNPGALMVDTSFYGYEGLRENITAEEYDEVRTQSEVYRLYTRMGWLVIQPNAAVVVEG